MLRGLFWGVPAPSRVDPSRLIQTPPAAVEISGRLLADVRRFPSGCSALLELDRSDGLSVQRLQSRSSALVMRVGHQRWQLVPSPQALWALRQRQRSEPRQLITGTWLGFKPSAPQRRWLLKHGAGARFVGL